VVATYTAPSAANIPASGFLTVTITALQSPATTGPCLVVYVLPTNNSLLFGRFVFRLKGFATSPAGLPFGIIGRFRFDGAGGITLGLEDVNIAQADGSSVAFTKVPFTGTYNMDTASHGTMTLTVTTPPWTAGSPPNPPPTTMAFSFTLSLDGIFGGLIETDGGATPAYVGSGDFQIQTNSAKFNTTFISGIYIMSLAGPAGTGANAVNKGFIGRVKLVATSALQGTIDPTDPVNSRGDDQSGAGEQTLTGIYTIDDQANGHGTFTITGTVNGTPHAVYTISFYIGYPKFFYALRTDNNVSANPDGILLGDVGFEPPTNPFTNTSLGLALFEVQGITTNGHASAAAGVFVGGAQISPPSTTNGFLQGVMDLNDGGSVPNSLPISFNPNSPATFTIAPIGRGTMSISLQTSTGPVTYNFVFYLNGKGGGYLLEQPPTGDPTNRGRSGIFVPQTVTSGPSGTLVASTGVATATSQNGLAVIPLSISRAGGNFQNAAEYLSILGSASTSSNVSGTSTAPDANNRGTIATAPGTLAGSSTAAYYLASDTEVIVIGTDGNNTEPQIILLTNTLPVNR
jgi:hypothetical protein